MLGRAAVTTATTIPYVSLATRLLRRKRYTSRFLCWPYSLSLYMLPRSHGHRRDRGRNLRQCEGETSDTPYDTFDYPAR